MDDQIENNDNFNLRVELFKLKFRNIKENLLQESQTLKVYKI